MTTMKLMLGMLACMFATIANADTELTDFDLAVRESLLHNPEIILEVFAKLEAQDAKDEQVADGALIEADRVALFGDQGEGALVEFVDYRCGYCRRAHTVLEELGKSHPDLRLRLIHFPILGEESVSMAQIMMALDRVLGAEVFTTVHNKVMSDNINNTPQLLALLRSGEIEGTPEALEQIMQRSEGDEIQAELSHNHALARRLKVSGTPGFVTHTRIIRGFAEAQALEAAVFGVNPEE